MLREMYRDGSANEAIARTLERTKARRHCEAAAPARAKPAGQMLVLDGPMSSDDEQWAEAQALVRQYRMRALAIADDRIADLVADAAGHVRWRAIRSRIVQIMEAGSKDDA